jgi:hypothetical protein
MASRPKENHEFARWLKQRRLEIQNCIPVEETRHEEKDAESKYVPVKGRRDTKRLERKSV